MKKIYYSWQDIEGQTQEVIRQITQDGWQPDYVVGLTRGGLVPANLISQYLGVPMETLKVSLRDDAKGPETNFWMAEDAFGGYFDKDNPRKYMHRNILIVDDINDTGATLDWIKKDWQSSKQPTNPLWDGIWNENVRFAVLVHNKASEFQQIDYYSEKVNKAVEDCWIVFPWEDWWKIK